MRMFTRMLGCAAAALLVPAVLFNLTVSWFDDETNVLQMARLLVFETRRSQAMDARAEMVARSMDLKRSIIAQLAAGRLSLREAIDQFRKANEMIDNDAKSLVATYRLPVDVEGVGRQVLAWAYHEVEIWPYEKAQRRLAELENEYQKLFGRPSPLDPSQLADPLPIGCCAG